MKNDNHDMDEEDDSKIFPQRLMEVLCDDVNNDAICWLPHGRAFMIRNRQLFADRVMPRFFPRKAKYSSFTRKLNRWNFVRVSSGPELGAYYHEFFLRDKPHLAAQMFCKNARAKLAMANDSLSQPKLPQQQQQQQPMQHQFPKKQPAVQQQQLGRQVSQPMRQQPTPQQIPSSLLLALQQQQQSKAVDTNVKGLLTPQLSNVQLLERQMQLLHQEQAQRVLVERLLQQQQQRQPTPAFQDPHQQNHRLMQMRQMMELRMQQRQGRVPHGSRAHAA